MGGDRHNEDNNDIHMESEFFIQNYIENSY